MNFPDFLKGDIGHDWGKPQRRFVEHQQTWLQHQTATYSEHLLFAAAHSAGELPAGSANTGKIPKTRSSDWLRSAFALGT
jgi:hypothetical protein